MTDHPHLAPTKSILAELVSFPSISADSNLAITNHIANFLYALGARVEIWPDATGQKANLFATLGPEGGGGIVLSGHTDVVPVLEQNWASDPFTLREADGRLYGRGTCDMKGFIACTLALAPAFSAAKLKRPLHFAFTHDEEVGCLGGQALVAELGARGLRPDIALIGEPSRMEIIEAHKGCCEYTVTFRGLSGHGSDPSAGVNAAECAASYMGNLLQLRAELAARVAVDSPFTPPQTTLNIGRIDGGTAHNVIPGLAEVAWEMRPVCAADYDFAWEEISRFVEHELLPQMRQVHPGATIETEVIGEVVGLGPEPNNAARALVSKLTGRNSAATVPFSTEAGLFQSLGTSAVVWGPGDIAQAHKPDEFIALDQLSGCLAALEDLVPVLESAVT